MTLLTFSPLERILVCVKDFLLPTFLGDSSPSNFCLDMDAFGRILLLLVEDELHFQKKKFRASSWDGRISLCMLDETPDLDKFSSSSPASCPAIYSKFSEFGLLKLEMA